MTKETFEKANRLISTMNRIDADIYMIGKALEETQGTSYANDTLGVGIYNGNGKSKTAFVHRQLVREMLNSAIEMYKKEKAKLQAEFDEM